MGGGNGRLDLPVPYGAEPFALEEGPNGMVWVITSSPGWTFVSQLTNGNLSLVGSFDAGPTASHSVPRVSDTLVITTDNAGAGAGYSDGGVLPPIALPQRASLVSQFIATDGGLAASFWLEDTNVYLQMLAPSPSLQPPQQVLPTSACSGLAFHDFAAIDVDAGCCGLIGFSGSCGVGIGAGIAGGSGIQVISTDNTRTGLMLESMETLVRVGHSAQGFDVATKPASTIFFRRFNNSRQQTSAYVISAGLAILALGDVSDGFVSFSAANDFTLEDAGVSIDGLTAVVAEPSTRRVITVGPSLGQLRLPILALPGRVLVLWKRDNGQLAVTQLAR